MNVWVVLLRGVNVGGKNSVEMKKLRELIEEQGFSAAQTYIQSGNIILTSDMTKAQDVADAVAGIVEKGFGFRPNAIALDSSEMMETVAGSPYPTAFPPRPGVKPVHVYFMAHAPEAPDLEGLKKLAADGEEFTHCGTVFYLYAPNGIGRSKLAAAVEKRLGEPATARNLPTVMKLAEMAESAWKAAGSPKA